MLRTIAIGSHIQIQGLFVKALDDGKVVVSVGALEYLGRPVNRRT